MSTSRTGQEPKRNQFDPSLNHSFPHGRVAEDLQLLLALCVLAAGTLCLGKARMAHDFGSAGRQIIEDLQHLLQSGPGPKERGAKGGRVWRPGHHRLYLVGLLLGDAGRG